MRVYNPRRQPAHVDGGHLVGGLDGGELEDGPKLQRLLADGRLLECPEPGPEVVADEVPAEASAEPDEGDAAGITEIADPATNSRRRSAARKD